MRTKDAPDTLKPYVFHGVDVDVRGNQAQADCPFCGRETKLGITVKTGQFRCVRCEESGNVHTFLQRLYAVSHEQTNERQLKQLAKLRQVPVEGLQAFGFAVSVLTDEWLIPAYNAKGSLANLSRVVKTRDGLKVFGSPGCKQHPFGTTTIPKEADTLFVVEGPWDGACWWHVINTHKRKQRRYVRVADKAFSIGRGAGVMAVPGAGNFQSAWMPHLKDRDVFLLYDNDHPRRAPSGKTIKPGWDGMQRVGLVCEESNDAPLTLSVLKWGDKGYDKELPDGYDCRDLVKDLGGAKALRFTDQRFEELELSPKEKTPETERVTPIERETFDELCNDWSSRLHFTRQLRDTLAVSISCVISTDLHGEQLWLRVIGPPGSGKSTIAEAVSAAVEHTFPISIQTGFHSGYGSKDEDSSLIPQMNHKTVVIKDGDTLLQSAARDRILSELRDIYDGTSRATYRNKKSNTYKGLRITFMLCGTDSLRTLNRSGLGERFIDVEILGEGDRSPYLDKAFENAWDSLVASIQNGGANDSEAHGSADMLYLKQTTAGLINHLKDSLTSGKVKPPSVDKTMKLRIKSLGNLLGYLRAKVDRDGDGLLYRPRVELGTRLVSQFTKLAVCLAVVLGKDSIDREVLRIIRKVALDTADGFQYELVALLYKYRSSGLSARQIELQLNIGEGTVRRLLGDCRELKIVERNNDTNRPGQRGRNRHLWRLTPPLKRLYSQALGKLPEGSK